MKISRKAPARAKTTSRRTKGKTDGAAAPVEVTREMISKRAYEIWLKNIRRAYQPAQDWVEAESQLRAELKKKPARARRPKASRPEEKPQETAAALAVVAPAEKADGRLAA
jgi:hypothetical protein